MRTICQKIQKAIKEKKNFKCKHDEVEWNEEKTHCVYSYRGNEIASIAIQKNGKQSLSIRTCGYETATTKNRLNSFDGVDVHQQDFQWFLNGEKWNDTFFRWTPIKTKKS